MMLKYLFLTLLGFIFLAVGAIGVFVPVWPTTPFALLAVACFSVNPKMQQKIMKIKFINEHVTNYKRRTGLKKSTVACSLAFLWISMGISMYVSKTPWVSVLLLLIGLVVTSHIVWISIPKNK